MVLGYGSLVAAAARSQMAVEVMLFLGAGMAVVRVLYGYVLSVSFPGST